MRNRYIGLGDIALIVIAAFGAFALRFDLLFIKHRPEFMPFLYTSILVKPVIFYVCGMYNRYWRYATATDLLSVVLAVTAASIAVAMVSGGALVLGYVREFSRSALLIDWLLCLLLMGGLRMSVRVIGEAHQTARRSGLPGQASRVIVIGAGEAGAMVVRELQRNPQLRITPVGFLDDAPEKVGKSISGVRVLGNVADLQTVAAAHRVNDVIIAMPAAGGAAVRTIAEVCRQAGLRSRIVPGVFEMLGGQITVSRLRNVEITDLLRRTHLAPDDRDRGSEYLGGATVLITGAGGSIGSELARQVADAGPAHLVLLGHGENSIFSAEATLRETFPAVQISTVIADIRDARRLATVFEQYRPAVVFHAAAHKHVPLMEQNPDEAITNNIAGTRNVVNQALRSGTERFVLISTDKAVSPSSIMGATKRVAEAIVRQAAQKSGRAFVVVRFGNVLGSRGSVVHTFKTQIERGGPITITHPQMTRYFMTIPEAVHLVIQAGGLGAGGELFVLNMGDPIKVVDLAKDLIRLSGLGEDDIQLTFTGMRPGEKLHESLYDDDMRTDATAHPEVLRVSGPDPCLAPELDDVVARLEEAARRGDETAILSLLRQTVPGFVTTRAPRADPTPFRVIRN